MIIRPWVVVFWATISFPLVLCNVFIPPEHRPGIIDDLRQIMSKYQSHIEGAPLKDDDLFCKCNEKGCDTEIIDVAGTNFSGICRVAKGGQCRTVEGFNENGQLHEVHFECLDYERLIPLNQPLLCVSKDDHPRLRQYCCDNASLCNDAIIPPLGPRRVNNHSFSMTVLIIFAIVVVVLVCCIGMFVCLLWLCNNKAKNAMRRFLTRLPFLNHAPMSPLQPVSSGSNHGGIEDNLLDFGDSSGHGLVALTKRTMARQITVSDTVVARGRFGEVRLGDWKGEQVAVKIFNSRDEASFWRESRIYMTNALKHPCLLRYIASDNKDAGIQTQLLIVTEYIPNGSLYDYLGSVTVDKLTGLKMMQSIIHGLAYLHVEIPGIQNDCHKPAIAHRDMKSKNVLVKKDLTCVLADLGMAAINSPDDATSEKKFGTIRYMAPELFSTEPITFAQYICADVYANALIFWEIARRMNYRPGGSFPYELPFFETCDRDPTFDEMRDIVVTQEKRPIMVEAWEKDETMKILTRVMTECWSGRPTSRLTALNVRIQVDRLVNAEEERLEQLRQQELRAKLNERPKSSNEPTVAFSDNVSYYTARSNSAVPDTSESVYISHSNTSDDIQPLIPDVADGNDAAQNPGPPNVIIAGPGPSNPPAAAPRARSGSRASNRAPSRNARPLSPLSERD